MRLKEAPQLGGTVEVRIGIKHSPRELSFETHSTPDEVRLQIETAFSDSAALFSLKDTKGGQHLINTDSIAYVELGAEAGRKVGFVN